VVHPPCGSHELLKSRIAASALDHHTPVRARPGDGSGNWRLTGERAEAIPDWRLESSSRLVECSTSTSSLPSSRLSTILSMRPPRPARPLNGTIAIVAPRASSSRQTASPPSSSRRPGRSLASWVREASRPDGVRHGSPAVALHVGHVRPRHPRATWSPVGGLVLRWYGERQRVPGAARHVGHHSLSHSARSLTTRPVVDAPPRRCSSDQSASGGLAGPPPPARRRPVSALEFRKTNSRAQRVHSASTRSTTTVNRPPQPYTPDCSCLQGFSARERASVNARKTLTLPW
jgi:hypothetical protein